MMAGATSNQLRNVSEEPRSMKDILKKFCSYTTTHGVGRLAETKSRFSRFIWAAFIVSAFAMFFYEAHGLFALYFSRPVSTVVKLRQATVSIYIQLRIIIKKTEYRRVFSVCLM